MLSVEGLFPDDEVPIGELVDAAGVDLGFDERAAGLHSPMITRWRDLDAELAAGAWSELRDFVDWMLVRYEIPEREIPGCWWRHGSVVEELSALRAAWDASFDTDTDGGHGPIGWHERFTLCRQRIRDHYHGECATAHQDRAGRREMTSDEGWQAWVAEAHNR